MNTLEKNIIGIYKETGREWLDQLPKQVQQLETLWGLKSLKPFDNLTYNYVLSGYKEEKPIVLKLSLDTQGLARETRALEAFTGCGVVSVLNSESNALLLERAVPGTPLF